MPINDDLKLDEIPPYDPSPEDQELVAQVDGDFERWRTIRRPHERQWFINGAFFRGQQWVQWHHVDQRLVVAPAPSHRRRVVINRMQAKIRARAAKFLKNRAKPEVLPATTELKDKLNARLTTKALEYAWRKLRLEEAYNKALGFSQLMGHGYWWLHWDERKIGRVQVELPVGNQFGEEMPQEEMEAAGMPMTEKVIADAQIGDVVVEVGSPFEVLVADPTISDIGKQPKIMRVTLRDIRDVRARYPEKGKYVYPESGDVDVMLVPRQLGAMNTQGTGQTGFQEHTASTTGQPTKVLVKELFCAPYGEYPKGRYVVTAGNVLLKKEDELPHGFWDLDNPYPVIDFPDLNQPGQYWIATIAEQMIQPQREYNQLRSKLSEHTSLMVHGKLIAAVQHQIPKGSWTSEAGEFIPYVAQPNIPPPQAWHPPPISNDVWQSLQLLVKEIEDITHIFPEAEGRVGESKSGFQTNLLQEATDAVHAPDIRIHELRIEEAGFKIRRIMKRAYSTKRLLTIAGRNMRPEVFEFSQENIDEHADIIVQAGSALPTYKAAKIQALLELFRAGIFGPPGDPETARKVLTMLDMGDVEQAYEDARQDEESADIENNDFAEGRDVADPEFYHHHDIHYRLHTAQLKSTDTASWSPERRLRLIRHTILHVKYINPQSAMMLAMQYQMADVLQDIQLTMAGQAPAPAPPTAQPLPEEEGTDFTAYQSGAEQFNPEFGYGPQGGQAL